ncbi:MAG: hypothetical protein Q9211_000235 [Gyalolechia sp. 1 TL-2023]
MDDIPKNPPEDIEPYTALNLTPSASPADIKTAYKKLALRHHPDKVPPSERITAHSTFQHIAFAYAILSSPHRRTLYDNTGSTSETLAADDDDFDWLSFFRTQYSSLSASALNDFSSSYKKSDEERKDVLTAYKKYEGMMGKVYEEVMLSNPLEDEIRFRDIIDGAIQAGDVEAYHAYVNETKKSKDTRMKKARREAEEARAAAKANAKYQSIFGGDGNGGRHVDSEAAAAGKVNTNGMKGENNKKARKADYVGKGDISDLAAMIQSRNKARSADFFGKLEAKYGGASTTGKGKKRTAEEEPDEDAFEKTRAKMAKAKAERNKNREVNSRTAKGRTAKRTVSDDVVEEEDDHDGDIDLEHTTDGDGSESDVAQDDSEEEEDEPKGRAQRGRAKKAAASVAKKRTTGRGRARK